MKLPTTKSKPVTDIHEYSFLIYGQPKSGKSTFASHFDNAIFIATEPGHKFLEVYKVSPKSWTDINSVFTELYQQRDDKKFKTIIIDTIDNLWQMAEAAVEKENSVKYVHDLEFGKGSRFSRSKVMKWINLLGQCGYGIVFLSHEKYSEAEEDGIKFSRKDITLSGASRKDVSGFCDFILYFYINKDGKRLIKTKGNKELNAGDRSGILPETLPMDFNVLVKELNKTRSQSVTKTNK
jgi:hypothetical protein